MIPTKIKFIAIINLILSIVLVFFMGVAALVYALASVSNGIYGILTLILIISIIGWILMFISSILLLNGSKVGFYLLLICWGFNIPNLSSIIGICFFIWMMLSLDILRNNEECRGFLKLSNSLFEKSWKKEKENKPIVETETTDKVKIYIQDSKKRGYSDEQIKTALRNTGYTEEQISSYFK